MADYSDLRKVMVITYFDGQGSVAQEGGAAKSILKKNPGRRARWPFAAYFCFCFLLCSTAGIFRVCTARCPLICCCRPSSLPACFSAPGRGAARTCGRGFCRRHIGRRGSGFNSVAFFLIGCAAGLFIQHLLGNTAVAALLLSAGAALLFETARYLFTYIVIGYANTGFYYVQYSLVSAALTTLLALPIYFLFKKLMKIAGR